MMVILVLVMEGVLMESALVNVFIRATSANTKVGS